MCMPPPTLHISAPSKSYCGHYMPSASGERIMHARRLAILYSSGMQPAALICRHSTGAHLLKRAHIRVTLLLHMCQVQAMNASMQSCRRMTSWPLSIMAC